MCEFSSERTNKRVPATAPSWKAFLFLNIKYLRSEFDYQGLIYQVPFAGPGGSILVKWLEATG